MTRTNDDMRRWIAENLLLGATAQSLHAAMLNEGFDADEAALEINTALASPYLQGSARLRNRLRKRDWTLSVYGQLSRMRASGAAVERRERLTRDEFFEQYYFQNRPVIITDAFDSWPARTQWSFDYFRERCGDCQVEVQFGRESDPNYEINQPNLKRTMPFREYVDLVERSRPTNDFYMTANNTSINRASLAALWEDAPTIREYLDPASPDTGFFWFGPGGTKTPFHHDLTNNFMAQVIGRKRVKLIPMSDTPYMYNHLHCYTQVDGNAIDATRFPAVQQANLIECTIGPGDLLFLPIGWWHYVEGLEPSVTMTYTNFVVRNDFCNTYDTYNEL